MHIYVGLMHLQSFALYVSDKPNTQLPHTMTSILWLGMGISWKCNIERRKKHDGIAKGFNTVNKEPP